MSDTKNPNVAVESPAEAPMSADERIAALEAMLTATQAQLAATEAIASGVKPARDAFVPIVRAQVRPVGWHTPGTDASFASSERKVVVTVQRYRNGKAKAVGSQAGLSEATYRALFANADDILALFAPDA